MTQPDYRLRTVWQQAASWACVVSLFFSGLWVASGLEQHLTFLPSFFRFNDLARAWADAWMAVVSTILVVLLVYTPPNQRKPDKITIYVFAPIALAVAVGCALFMLFVAKSVVPDVISGLSLFGLTAGVARTLPFSSNPNT